MAEQDPLEKTDYAQHTDEELRRGIEKIDREEPRVREEDSREAAETARRQRVAMQAELDRRENT